LRLGGIPGDESRTTRYALTIPRGLSLLVNRNPNSKIIGLDHFAPNDWPNVRLVHWSFDLMILCGLALIALSMAVVWLAWKHRGIPDGKWILRTIVAAGPLGLLPSKRAGSSPNSAVSHDHLWRDANRGSGYSDA